jgi:DNA-binding IclR family transcriptional regulator
MQRMVYFSKHTIRKYLYLLLRAAAPSVPAVRNSWYVWRAYLIDWSQIVNSDGMLAKGLSLLEALGKYPHGAGVTQIAREVTLPPSTTHRLLSTLVGLGFAGVEPETRRYYLGLKVFELSSQVSFAKGLSELALPIMKKLAEATGESIFMGVRDDTDIVCIERVVSRNLVQVDAPIGNRVPLHRLAQGKAILAYLPEPEREEILGRASLEPGTQKTIVDPQELHQVLDETRERGWAIADEENEKGVRAIAVPLMNGHNVPVAAIAIAAPAFRASAKDLKRLAPVLSNAVRELEMQLSHSNTLLATAR